MLFTTKIHRYTNNKTHNALFDFLGWKGWETIKIICALQNTIKKIKNYKIYNINMLFPAYNKRSTHPRCDTIFLCRRYTRSSNSNIRLPLPWWCIPGCRGYGRKCVSSSWMRPRPFVHRCTRCEKHAIYAFDNIAGSGCNSKRRSCTRCPTQIPWGTARSSKRCLLH